MRKKFKTKRSKGKLLLLFILLYLIYESINYIYISITIPKDNQEFLEYVINNSDYKKIFEAKEKNIFDKIFSMIIDIEEPKTLVNNYVYEEALTVNNNYNPNIYIFNSHPKEEYSNVSLEVSGIAPDVIMASYLLKEKLEGLFLNPIVEETNFYDYMVDNNLNGTNAYVIARPFVEEKLNTNNFDLIIDVHRDSINKEKSTIEINGKNYAKILFVVGNSNKNYKENLKLANLLNNLIPEEYKKISRGVYLKPDCIFNQDLSSKMILLEIGGYQNTIDEVYNSIEIITNIIKEFLNEERG